MHLKTRRTLLALAISMAGCGPPADNSARQAPSQTPIVTIPPSDAAPLTPTVERQRTIQTLEHFQVSIFCEQYDCANPNTYALRSGGNNTSYRTSLDETNVEVQTNNERVSGFGLSLNERDALSPFDVAAIRRFLTSIDQDADVDAALAYIDSHIDRNIFQIDQASPGRFGDYIIKAGTVRE